jgi:tetratricopeptide (TPR) repeat protein
MKKIITLLFSAMLLLACQGGKQNAADGASRRELAADLLNRSLFKQAIAEYEGYLDHYDVDETEQANITFIIANTYFDRLKLYDEALAHYLKIKHLYPESKVVEQVNKRIIACLERLDRSTDAQQALDEAVQADPAKVVKQRPGAVVAKIGNREITQGDLNFEIDQLPPTARDQFRSKDKKLEFLKEFVATELLYDTAKRAGLENDSQVVEGAFQAKKMLMVRRLVQDKIAAKINIAESDLDLYYQAHKDDYAEKDKDGKVTREKSLSEVRQQVAQDLYRQKYQDAFQSLMNQMTLAENVQFYENQVQ